MAQMAAAAVHQEAQEWLQQVQARRVKQARQAQQQQQQKQQQQKQQKQKQQRRRRQVQAAAAADLQYQPGISSPNLSGVKTSLQAPPGTPAAETQPLTPLN